MSIDGDGPRTLAAAICHLAAASHSKDHAHQQQIAGLFYENCINDFDGAKIDQAVEAWFADFLKKPLKR